MPRWLRLWIEQKRREIAAEAERRKRANEVMRRWTRSPSSYRGGSGRRSGDSSSAYVPYTGGDSGGGGDGGCG